jgi:hypothetical protein
VKNFFPFGSRPPFCHLRGPFSQLLTGQRVALDSGRLASAAALAFPYKRKSCKPLPRKDFRRNPRRIFSF